MCAIAAAAVSFVVIPATLHASIPSTPLQAHHSMEVLSRGISIPLIVLYILYMAFRLQPRADFMDERVYVGEGMEVEHSFGTIPAAITMALAVVVMLAPAWYLVNSIGCAASLTSVPESFFAIILLPLVASSAAMAPAVFFTYEDTMNLAINVVGGSAMQIALLVMPFLVLLGWLIDQRMTLHFQPFESIVLFLSVFVVVLHIQDGRSTYVSSSICLAT
jgi:Ca2+:H+ antiporter